VGSGRAGAPQTCGMVELDRAELVGVLGFLQLEEQPPEVAVLRRWLDSWAGLGVVLDGMVKLDFDVALTRNGDAGWRALFFPSSFIHESRFRGSVGDDPLAGRAASSVGHLAPAPSWLERPRRRASRTRQPPPRSRSYRCSSGSGTATPTRPASGRS